MNNGDDFFSSLQDHYGTFYQPDFNHLIGNTDYSQQFNEKMNNDDDFFSSLQDLYETLYEAEWAYHVTQEKAEHPQPDFNHLISYTDYSQQFNDPYFTMNGIFFGVTLFDGETPSESPYPMTGEPGDDHWRVKVSLQTFNKHKFFYCLNPPKSRSGIHQVTLVLAKNPSDLELVSRLSCVQEIDASDNPFLRRSDNLFLHKWYANEMKMGSSSGIRYFVSLFVVNGVQLEHANHEWDTVTKFKVPELRSNDGLCWGLDCAGKSFFSEDSDDSEDSEENDSEDSEGSEDSEENDSEDSEENDSNEDEESECDEFLNGKDEDDSDNENKDDYDYYNGYNSYNVGEAENETCSNYYLDDYGYYGNKNVYHW